MFPFSLVNGFHHLQSLAQALHGLIQVNDGSAVSLTFQAPFHVGMRPTHMMSNVDVCLHEVGQVGRNVHDVLLEKGALRLEWALKSKTFQKHLQNRHLQ